MKLPFFRTMQCLVLAVATALAPAALAGDFAERRIIGFSADGKYFAFEQFGVQDGSGFPYAEIFVIDIEKDAWAPDTPIRISLREEGKTLADARTQASSQAAAALSSLKIDRPGVLLASNPPGESGADPLKVGVDARFELPSQPDAYTLTLASYKLPSKQMRRFRHGRHQGLSAADRACRWRGQNPARGQNRTQKPKLPAGLRDFGRGAPSRYEWRAEFRRSA